MTEGCVSRHVCARMCCLGGWTVGRNSGARVGGCGAQAAAFAWRTRPQELCSKILRTRNARRRWCTYSMAHRPTHPWTACCAAARHRSAMRLFQRRLRSFQSNCRRSGLACLHTSNSPQPPDAARFVVQRLLSASPTLLAHTASITTSSHVQTQRQRQTHSKGAGGHKSGPTLQLLCRAKGGQHL